MTKSKVENSLYRHTKSLLNGVLPMEYAIRALRENDNESYSFLSKLNNEIRSRWLKNGFTDSEIEHEKLMDMSWDMLQVGMSLSRVHNRYWLSSDIGELVRNTVLDIRNDYQLVFDEREFPLIDRYRVVDLLNGNDIEKLTKKVISAKFSFNKYGEQDEIPFEEFVVGGFREAILLYPGSIYQWGECESPKINGYCAGLILDFSMEKSDIHGAMKEFLYQYAKLREGYTGDNVSSELISEFLYEELIGSNREQEIIRLDSILTGLLGLFCYDQVAINKASKNSSGERVKPVEGAVDKTIELFFNSDIGESKANSIKKNYQTVRNKIKETWVRNCLSG